MTISKERSLAQWLAYLETRHRAPIQLGLERLTPIANALGVLSFDIPIITIAGTNGKGSTVAALERIYCSAGFCVAAYTSPHLLQFNERIRVNQVPISDSALCDIFAFLHTNPDTMSLTYFEMATLAALLYFKREAPDVMLLEVGMGGRLDATNILNADLSILTTVDLDHQTWLGETREAIGVEKAGIFRANQPVVYADENPPQSVLDKARDLNVSWTAWQQDFYLEEDATGWVFRLANNVEAHLPRASINPKAAAAALMASDCLRHVLPVTEMDWSNAMRHVTIPGRLQRIEGPVVTLLDVAHNPQSVGLLCHYLRLQRITGQIHAVFSALNDKDLEGLVNPLLPLVSQWYGAPVVSERGTTQTQLEALFSGLQVRTLFFTNLQLAYQEALSRASVGDWIVVYGSFLTVGPVLAWLNQKENV